MRDEVRKTLVLDGGEVLHPERPISEPPPQSD